MEEHGDEDLIVSIEINEKEFKIEDNCGGINRSDLENEVFIFGLPKPEADYSGLSAFGIGMKRAFFKLGKKIDLITRSKENESAIMWDVDKWLKEGDTKWEIPFTEKSSTNLDFEFESHGTLIRIDRLNPQVIKRVKQTEFISLLRNRLETSYALFLKSGLKIKLNGEYLTYSMPSFFTSEEINYASKHLAFDNVDIRIIAGISPVEDRIPRGWYIFCNGRMVLEGDKSENTGWATGLPMFHPKFNHFLGFVSFTSSDVKTLPWSSTKWGIESDSPVYIYALEEMRLQAKPILDFLDRWKDNSSDDELPLTGLKELLGKGNETSVFASAKVEDNFTYQPKKERSEFTKISFSKNKEIVVKVKEFLGNPKMKNADLGEFVFDYYVENEMD